MKKTVLSGLLAVFLFSFSPAALADDSLQPGEYGKTTESDILFLSLPWRSDMDLVLENVEKRLDYDKSDSVSIPVDSFYGTQYDKVSRNFADPKGIILLSYVSDLVNTKRVTYSNTCLGKQVGKIAGYPVGRVSLRFIEDSDGDYSFYSGEYSFNETDDIDSLTQFMDLQQKITSLYGNPYTYTFDDREGTSDIKTTNMCCVWTGNSESAVVLTYKFYTSGYLLAGSDHVYLEYGTTGVNDIFERAIAGAKEAEKQEEDAAADRRQKIFSDNSGL